MVTFGIVPALRKFHLFSGESLSKDLLLDLPTGDDPLGGYSKRSFDRLSPENKWNLRKAGTMPNETIKKGS
jgi:hypothetical protein